VAAHGCQLLQTHGQPTAGDDAICCPYVHCLKDLLIPFTVSVLYPATVAKLFQHQLISSYLMNPMGATEGMIKVKVQRLMFCSNAQLTLLAYVMQALLKYNQIHSSHPLNVECLRYLVNICGQLGKLAAHRLYLDTRNLCISFLCEIAFTCPTFASRYAHLQQLIILYFRDDVKLAGQSGMIKWRCMSVDRQLGTGMLLAGCKYGANRAYSSNCLHLAGLKPEEADFVARLRKAERQRADPRVRFLHIFLLN